MSMQKIKDEQRVEAKAALDAAIGALLDGAAHVTIACGGWEVEASREEATGYHIRLRFRG